jgi:hypothetical protein
MDCTVVVLPSVPELEVAVGGAKVEVATGGGMSRVGTGSVGTEGTTRSEDGGVRTADMESSEGIESEAGRTPLVKPMSMKALVAVSGRSSTVPAVSKVRVISLTSPVIPVSEYSIVDLNTKGPSVGFRGF